MELLYDGNETVLNLTGHQLQSIQRFNRFIISSIYLQSWFSTRSAVDAPINDIYLIRRLHLYDDSNLRYVGLRMMTRHSWYLSPELTGLAVFSDLPSAEEKSELISNMSDIGGFHVLKTLPSSFTGLKISRTFFSTTDIDDSFLDILVHEWQQSESYQTAASTVCNIPCVNDIAERGVVQFNSTTNQE